MSLLTWVLVGAGCGLLADLFLRHYGLIEDIIVGVVGSVATGWVFVLIAGTPVTEATLLGVASSAAGSIGLLALSRTLTQGRGAI